MERERDNISFDQWVVWIACTLVAAVTLTAFIYTNFQTKGEASVFKADLDKRLERIESKIDALLGRGRD